MEKYEVGEDALFATVGGSHMWSMQTPESDVDILEVYAMKTRDVLRGEGGAGSRRTKPTWKGTIEGVEYDVDYMEIGHLVKLLAKGNCNAIWGVMSPLVRKTSPWLTELRGIVESNPAKNIYPSIKGMATSQRLDAVKRAEVRARNKSLTTAWRTLCFGAHYLATGECEFIPSEVTEYTQSELDWGFNSLEGFLSQSTLPDHPDEEKYRDFLYKVRIHDLLGVS